MYVFASLGTQCNILLEKVDNSENGERDLTGTKPTGESEIEAGIMESEITEDEKSDMDTEDEDYKCQEEMESEVEDDTALR